MHALKAKIIKDALTFAVLELGAAGTVDLVSEICKKIAAEGGGDVESLGVHFDAMAWERDYYELQYMKDKLHT